MATGNASSSSLINGATALLSGGGGGGAVSSVSNSDSTLTITPTTGAVVGSLNLSHVNAWTGQQYFAQASLTDASTIAWNANTQQAAYVLLTAAVGSTRILGLPSNLQAGASYTLIIQQSSTGSNALTYAAGYKWSAGVAPVLSTANNAIDIITFITDGTNMYGVPSLMFQ